MFSRKHKQVLWCAIRGHRLYVKTSKNSRRKDSQTKPFNSRDSHGGLKTGLLSFIHGLCNAARLFLTRKEKNNLSCLMIDMFIDEFWRWCSAVISSVELFKHSFNYLIAHLQFNEKFFFTHSKHKTVMRIVNRIMIK